MTKNRSITVDVLDNGLTVIIEQMPEACSLAYQLHFGGGLLNDPEDKIGASLILGDIFSRGAGKYSAEALSNVFDESGIVHGEGSSSDRIFFKAAMLPEDFLTGIELLSTMVNEPLISEEEIENIRSLLLLDIATLTDSPSRQVMVELGKIYYPNPYDRPSLGTESGLKAVQREDLLKIWHSRLSSKQAIFSVAGNIKRDVALKTIEKKLSFSKNNKTGVQKPTFSNFKKPVRHHISSDTAQVQIAVAYPAPAFCREHYYEAKVASQILSGGMFGRLFIEVREKRGLCYSVGASHQSGVDYGTVIAYAGTTPERADETLNVLLAELRSIKGTVTEDEIKRAKANLKSSLVIGDESSSARAGSNLNDWWYGKRLRTDEEILSNINAVNAEKLDSYFTAFPLDPFTVVTLGPRELNIK